MTDEWPTQGLPRNELCPYCHRRFASARGVDQHIARKHKALSRGEAGGQAAKMREYHNEHPRLVHASDCALHNPPAYPAGPCDCGAIKR